MNACDRHRVEAVGDGGDVERLDDAVGDQLAEPVVGADDDVGPSPLGAVSDSCSRMSPNCSSWTAIDDAVLLGERLGDLLDHGFAGVVGPDHEVGVAAGGGGRRRLGGGRGLGACGLRAGWLSAGRDGGGPGGAGRAEHSSCREE